MNPVLTEIASTTSAGWVAGVMTALFLMFFVGWAVWAWWPANQGRMSAMSRLPLEDDSFGGEA